MSEDGDFGSEDAEPKSESYESESYEPKPKPQSYEPETAEEIAPASEDSWADEPAPAASPVVEPVDGVADVAEAPADVQGPGA